MNRLHKAALAGGIGLLVAASYLPAYAAERVTLRNGSQFVCDHQKNFNGQIRLYLTPSDENYLDVAATDIVGRVAVPAAQAKPVITTAKPASSIFPAAPTPAQLAALLKRAGAEHHLDPDLLASVVHAESGGRPGAVSRVGARGLMQLMPATAKDLGVGDSFAPEQNVSGGTTYLDALLMYYHDNLALALAAYNAGPAAVNRYGGVPPYPETRRYVERVIHDYNRRKLREARQRRSRLPGHTEMAAISARP